MRIGTWNLAGRFAAAHRNFLLALDCDVLLLTEVREDVSLSGYDVHATAGNMVPGRRWAAVASRGTMAPLDDPHPASAAVVIDEVTYCSSVLPWATCGQSAPWVGTTLAEKTTHAVDQLMSALPASDLVWGGDWNQSLSGRCAGSRGGRQAILKALVDRGLQVPTQGLAHRLDGITSIDHIALAAPATRGERLSATVDERRLSDHDAYVVTAP